LPDVDETQILSTDFWKKKHSNIKIHENPSSGSRAIPCVRTDRRADMTKLTVVFFQILRTRLKIVHKFYIPYTFS